METIACLGICVVYQLLKMRNKEREKLRGQGVTDNGKVGDQGLDFEYNL